MMARVFRGLMVLLVALPGCDVDDPEILPPTIAVPRDIGGGIFRLTFHVEADLYPNWLDTATIGYRSAALLPYEDSPLFLARSIRGGPSHDRLASLREQGVFAGLIPVREAASGPARHVTFWQRGDIDSRLCGLQAPTTISQAVNVYRTDDAPADSLARLPLWVLPTRDVVETGPLLNRFVRLRITPADSDATWRGANPFGPTWGPSGLFYVSDGRAVFRTALDQQDVFDSVTVGAHPAVSPDGTLLAFERVAIADSSAQVDTITAPFSRCVQTTIRFQVSERAVWVRTLATAEERLLSLGSQPVFDASGTRLVVATGAELAWLELATGAVTPIPGTSGAHSPSLSADGRYLAFVAEWSGQADIYFMAIVAP